MPFRRRLELKEVLYGQQQIEFLRQPESGAAQFVDGLLFNNAVLGPFIRSHVISG